MLVENWKSDLPIVESIASFQVAANRWNQDSFGHMGRQKHTLLARIYGIKCANESSDVLTLGKLEEQLKHELNQVLQQEESLWFQCSCSEWIADRDHNTKYYHRITKAKQH
ncbi:hypothetical protein V6N13_030049 [Hibiscus sabdariffa]